jgi:hypothetical protein
MIFAKIRKIYKKEKRRRQKATPQFFVRQGITKYECL